MVVFAAIFIPLGLLMRLFLGRGNTNGDPGSALSPSGGEAAAKSKNDVKAIENKQLDGPLAKRWKPRTSGKDPPHNIRGASNPAKPLTESKLPDNPKEARFQSLYRDKFDQTALGYDVRNCPSTPPEDYPRGWAAPEVLTNWNPNDVTTISPKYREVYLSLCVFDYQTQYDVALAYRNAEKPFVIRNDPSVMEVVRRWDDDPEYLHKKLGDENRIYTERSPKNHFMYYNVRKRKQVRNWRQPENDVVSMSYGEWLERALLREAYALDDPEIKARSDELREKRMTLPNRDEEDIPDDDEIQVDNDRESEKRMKWYYFRLNAFLEEAKGDTVDKFVFDEVAFFDPRNTTASHFYFVEPEDQRGINCRFGMRGIVAENHYDLSRNMIAILGGERRYIIAHPAQCSKMGLYPAQHPSGRHSSFDWSNPSDWDVHPEFRTAEVNEVVLHASDVLYLPTSWFHYISNLSLNYQCNIRSGIGHENADAIRDCGFNPKDKPKDVSEEQ